MKRYLLAILLFAHVAMVMMMLGAVLMEACVNIPGWLRAAPIIDELQRYAYASDPWSFIMMMYIPVILLGIAFTAAAWRAEPARIYTLISTVLFMATALVLDIGFVWSKMSAMIKQAEADASPYVFVGNQAQIQEMLVLVQLRLVLILIAAGLSIFALWRFYMNAPKQPESMPPLDVD